MARPESSSMDSERTICNPSDHEAGRLTRRGTAELPRARRRVRVRRKLCMQNCFYNAFDRESLGEIRKSDYRTPFQMDRDRIIHAHAFRKLQSKTQVFLS